MFRPGKDHAGFGHRRGASTTLNSYNNGLFQSIGRGSMVPSDSELLHLIQGQPSLKGKQFRCPPTLLQAERTAAGLQQTSPFMTLSKLNGPVLPSIVKQSQSPLMKPFVSRATKAIKDLKQRTPRVSIIGNEMRLQQQEDFLSIVNRVQQTASGMDQSREVESSNKRMSPRNSQLESHRGSSFLQGGIYGAVCASPVPSQQYPIEMDFMPSSITGTKCLIPVSENEDMQIKAAMVNLRRLKVDIEVKNNQQNSGEAVPVPQANSTKRDSTTMLNTFTIEQPISETPDGNKTQIFPSIKLGVSAQDFTTTESRVAIMKEMKLPQSQGQKGLRPKGALPARLNPQAVVQAQKQMTSFVNLSKYKQLKRYNDSLMKIQQDMVQALRDRARQMVALPEENEPFSPQSNYQQQFDEKSEHQPSIPQINAAPIQDYQTIEQEQQDEIDPPTRRFTFSSDFQYNHHKFVPKKTFYSSKRDFSNDYKKLTQLNDNALTINQASIQNRFPIIADRIYHQQDESTSQVQEPHTILSQDEESPVMEPINNNKVIVNQNDYIDKQHKRQLAQREKIETLHNLRETSIKKSSTMTISQSSSIITNNLAKNQHNTVFSASSNRVTVVHKQHSASGGSGNAPDSPNNGKNFSFSNPKDGRPNLVLNKSISKGQHSKIRLINGHRSKTTLKERENVTSPINNNPSLFKKKDSPRGVGTLDLSLPNKLNIKEFSINDKGDIVETSRIEYNPPKQIMTDRSHLLKEGEQFLKVKMNILKDLEFLREAQKAKHIQYIKNKKLEENQDQSKFFQTEVAIAQKKPTAQQLPRDIRELTEGELSATEDNNAIDDFSLNFPMRNSRLSKVVMASITQEAMSRKSKETHRITSDSMTLDPQRPLNQSFTVKSTTNPNHNSLQTNTLEIFNQSYHNELERIEPITIFEVQSTTRKFIKAYFKQELGVFKDAELKQRMISVRRAVANLEREHFQAKKSAESQEL